MEGRSDEGGCRSESPQLSACAAALTGKKNFHSTEGSDLCGLWGEGLSQEFKVRLPNPSFEPCKVLVAKGSRSSQQSSPCLFSCCFWSWKVETLQCAFPIFVFQLLLPLECCIHILATSLTSLGYKESSSVLFALLPSIVLAVISCVLRASSFALDFVFLPWFYAFQLISLVLQSLIAQPRSGLFYSFWSKAFSLNAFLLCCSSFSAIDDIAVALLLKPNVLKRFPSWKKLKRSWEMIFMGDRDAFSSYNEAWA